MRSVGLKGNQIAPQRMLLVHGPREEIQAEPAPLILEGGLCRQPVSGADGPGVFGLDQLRVGHTHANRPHGVRDAAALIQQGRDERASVAPMREPVPVQPRKPGGGERLIDRGVAAHPRIPFREGRGIGGQARRKSRIEQMGRPRAAAMVHETDDRIDAEIAEAPQRGVAPSPVGIGHAIRGDPLPQGRIAQRPDAQRGHRIEVIQPRVVSASGELIEKSIAHPIDRAFKAAPELDGGLLRHEAMHSARRTPAIFAKVVRAWATT